MNFRYILLVMLGYLTKDIQCAFTFSAGKRATRPQEQHQKNLILTHLKTRLQ